MPSLRQLKCRIEFSPQNIPLQEYGVSYGDGLAQCYIAVPDKLDMFSIHLTSHGYIAPGLAAFVFVDGIPQCNRNRCGLQLPDDKTSTSDFEVDLRLRQKEVKFREDFIAREWTFADLNIGKRHPLAIHRMTNKVVDGLKPTAAERSVFDNIGTIEVVVLRCYADDTLEAGSKQPSGKKSTLNVAVDTGKSLVKTNGKKEKTQPSDAPSMGLDGANDSYTPSPPVPERFRNQNQPDQLNGSEHAFQNQRPRNVQPEEHAQGWIPGPQTWNYAPPYPYPPPWMYPPWFGYQQPPLQPPSEQRYAGQWGPMWASSVGSINGEINRNEDKTPPTAPKAEDKRAEAPRQSDQWNDDAQRKNVHQEAVNQDADRQSGHVPQIWENEPPGEAKDTDNESNWHNSNQDIQKEDENDGWADKEDTDNIKDNQWEGGNNEWSNEANEDGGLPNDDAWEKASQKGMSQNKAKSEADSILESKNQNKSEGKASKKTVQTPKPTSKAEKSKASPMAFDGARSLESGYVKSYWKTWKNTERAEIKANGKTQSEKDSACFVPAEPLHRVPQKIAKEKNISHQVKIGGGKLYAHPTYSPRYIDSMEAPYAVFVFKYRSKEMLKQIVPGIKIRSDKVPMRDRLQGMSKNEIMEYALKLHETLRSESESSASSEGGKTFKAQTRKSDKKSDKKGKHKKHEKENEEGNEWSNEDTQWDKVADANGNNVVEGGWYSGN